MFAQDYSKLDLNGGYLCHWSYWRPDPDQPDLEMPGLKQMTITYIPAAPQEDCLCGSGKSYADCCRANPYWYPICPDPGWQGTSFSLVSIQSAAFHNVNGPALRERLMEDVRLHCTEDGHERGFWTYWGDPALKATPGIMCFGDFELKRGRILLVTAMSDVRMRTLLDLLQEVAGDLLQKPRIQYDPVTVIDKRTRKMRTLPAPRRAREK